MADRLMKSAYEKLFQDRSLNIESATIALYLPFTDKFRGESEKVAYRTRMDAETGNRVHWEKRNDLDFTQLWETIFLHPDLHE